MTDRWQNPLTEISRVPMTPGLFEASRRGPQFPPPRSRAPARVVAVVVAVAVALGAAFAVRPLLQTTPGSTITNDTFGWTVQIPEGWQQLHPVAGSEEAQKRLGPVLANVTFIANEQAATLDDAPLTGDELTSVPLGGVLLGIDPSGSVLPTPGSDDHDYPPAPALAPRGPGSEQDFMSFQADGVRYEVLATYGEGASDLDRQTARDIASSMTVPSAPAPPAEGTAVARFPDNPDLPMLRLGPADRFALGTVSEVRVEPVAGTDLPTSLFIVISTTTPTASYGRWGFQPPDFPCDFIWTGTEFACGGKRWDVEGYGMGRTGDLHPFFVLETWEGQLIASLWSEASFPPA